jgi:CDP-4-dehydro-6-deoxyglucose reductase
MDLAATTYVVTLANGKQFPAQPGTSLLNAARAAGLALEHSCETGRCGACRARVLAGDACAVGPGTALTEEERQSGWLLTCADAARTDISLDIESLDPAFSVTAKTHPARIDSLTRLAPDVLAVRLRLPPAAGFGALPGQHIEVTSPHGVRRRYSLANAVQPGQPIELHVKRVDNGRFSQYWFDAARGNDLLRLRGPLGSFHLGQVQGLHAVFLATGTGIAPLRSMLQALAARPASEQPLSTTLYWGGRLPADLYLDPMMAGLRYVPVLSRAGSAWTGARGHVQDIMLAEPRATLADAVVYACGSAGVIQAARQQLQAAGLPDSRFHCEAFVASD